MVRVWRYGDAAIPEAVNRLAFRGGDEDFVVVGSASDFTLFEYVAVGLERLWGNNWNPEQVQTVTIDGEELLVWTVCHA